MLADRKDYNQTCMNNYECSTDMYCRNDSVSGSKQCACTGYRSLNQTRCKPCPTNMEVYDTDGVYYPNRCYFTNSTQGDFNESKSFCENLANGASLMRITNSMEQDVAESISISLNYPTFWVF